MGKRQNVQEESGTMISSMNYDNYRSLVHPRNKKVQVIKLWHHKCPMCKELRPIYEKLAELYKDDFNFFEVNVIDDKHRLEVVIKQAATGIENPKDITFGVPEIYFFYGHKVLEIPWPEKATESGYSEEYLKTFFDHYKWFRSFHERNVKLR